jgi:hypothetical protein
MYEALSCYYCMRPSATSVWGLKLCEAASLTGGVFESMFGSTERRASQSDEEYEGEEVYVYVCVCVCVCV